MNDRNANGRSNLETGLPWLDDLAQWAPYHFFRFSMPRALVLRAGAITENQPLSQSRTIHT